MYRYYKAQVNEIDGLRKPDPEPDNWLGYEANGYYYVKTKEKIDAIEVEDDEVKDLPVKTSLLLDQFP